MKVAVGAVPGVAAARPAIADIKRITHAVEREASQDMQGVYEGAALAAAVYPCGTNWTTLSVVVHSPPANATHNGTALQLRLAPPPSARGWGATVWLGAASVVELNTGV